MNKFTDYDSEGAVNEYYEINMDECCKAKCSEAIDNAGMCITIAGAQEAAGDYEGAIENYDRALAYAYTSRITFLSYLGRGRVKSILRDLSGAVEDLNNALYYDFRSTEAYLLRSFVNSQLGRKKESIEDLAKAYELIEE